MQSLKWLFKKAQILVSLINLQLNQESWRLDPSQDREWTTFLECPFFWEMSRMVWNWDRFSSELDFDGGGMPNSHLFHERVQPFLVGFRDRNAFSNCGLSVLVLLVVMSCIWIQVINLLFSLHIFFLSWASKTFFSWRGWTNSCRWDLRPLFLNHWK